MFVVCLVVRCVEHHVQTARQSTQVVSVSRVRAQAHGGWAARQTGHCSAPPRNHRPTASQMLPSSTKQAAPRIITTIRSHTFQLLVSCLLLCCAAGPSHVGDCGCRVGCQAVLQLLEAADGGLPLAALGHVIPVL